jgi:hypothetical protein
LRPTIFVLDPQGVIRYKGVISYNRLRAQELDRLVEKLVRETSSG